MPPTLSQAIYTLGMAVGHGALRLLARGDGKVARGVRGMGGSVGRLEAWARQGRDPARPLVWFHAPSVGEGLQARAVMEELVGARPDLQLAYTYFSPSAERFSHSVPADVTDYLPPDLPEQVERALDALAPDVLIFSKTEVWPNLTRAAAARGAAVALLSATLPPSSSRLRFPAAVLLKEAHATLARVGAISAADAERFARLGADPTVIELMGDARFDQVWKRAAAIDPSSPLLASLKADDRLTLVAGSTWPADEAHLVTALEALEPGVRPRLIIAPHEPTPDALRSVDQELARLGSSAVRLSEIGGGARTDTVVVDRVGVLGELYHLADIAYVGGGFGHAGLHSILEPAAFGAPVLFGPRHGNAREAAELIGVGGARSIGSADELRTSLREWLTDEASRRAAGSAARRFVEDGLGAATRGARIVLELLRSPPTPTHHPDE